MAIIQIKRGLQENVEKLSLGVGEFALAKDTGNLYIGTEAGKALLNPADAAKLTTARSFSINGDGTAPAVNFDGTGNVALALTLANSGVTAGTYTKLTVDAKGRVTAGAAIAVADLPSIPKSKVTGLGTAAALDTGTTAGKVVVVGADGKLPDALLPNLAISDTFEAASETVMLGLNAQKGDICIRTDEGKSYILAASPASSVENWKWLKTPDCKVLSVNGKTGAVTLAAADVGAVPTTRKVNGKALSADVTLSAADVGARANSWTPTAADVGAVPTTRKVNGKALSADVTLSAADVGARASTWTPTAADVGAEAPIKNAAAKTTLADADTLPLSDSAASSATKKITFANLKAALKTYFDTLYNKYVHPTYTAHAAGLYKITNDATGHVSVAAAVTKADITALGIPGQDTVYTLPTASATVLGGVKVGAGLSMAAGVVSVGNIDGGTF